MTRSGRNVHFYDTEPPFPRSHFRFSTLLLGVRTKKSTNSLPDVSRILTTKSRKCVIRILTTKSRKCVIYIFTTESRKCVIHILTTESRKCIIRIPTIESRKCVIRIPTTESRKCVIRIHTTEWRLAKSFDYLRLSVAKKFEGWFFFTPMKSFPILMITVLTTFTRMISWDW